MLLRASLREYVFLVMLEPSSPDLLRLLVEHSPTPVAVFDHDMRYLVVNNHHLVAYGLAGEGEVIGVSHADLVSALPEKWEECWRRCLEDGLEVCVGEASLVIGGVTGSTRRQLCWEMHSWRNVNGELAGVVVFTSAYAEEPESDGQYVSERLSQSEVEVRRAREELAIARADVLEANRLKSAFLATMSHELRTPLASILLFCEMLLEDAVSDGNEALAADLARVVGAGQQLRTLIDDLLEFSKLESGRSKVEPSPFDISQLLHQLAVSMRPLLEKTNNTLEVRCSEELGVMISDAGKVKQSLMNLLSNACKFTEGGRITLEAFREKESNGECIILRVTDTGIGISKEVLPRLFQDFVQGDPSLTRKYGGTGLGLAMTRRYVEMMGGTVKADSEAGQGAVFTISLPIDVTTL